MHHGDTESTEIFYLALGGVVSGDLMGERRSGGEVNPF